MDDVAIFDTALPDAAIPQVMFGGAHPHCSAYASPTYLFSLRLPTDFVSARADFKSVGGGLCVRASAVPVPPPPTPPGVLFDVEVDLTVGVVIEATLSCASANTTAGFWVRGSSDDSTFVWNCATQTFTVGGDQPIDRKPGFAASGCRPQDAAGAATPCHAC